MTRRGPANQPGDLCECGDTRETHDHYRPGTDCGRCGRTKCPAFRLATRATPVPADEVPPTVDATA